MGLLQGPRGGRLFRARYPCTEQVPGTLVSRGGFCIGVSRVLSTFEMQGVGVEVGEAKSMTLTDSGNALFQFPAKERTRTVVLT